MSKSWVENSSRTVTTSSLWPSCGLMVECFLHHYVVFHFGIRFPPLKVTN
jgi:hypothetical protein